MRVHFGLPEDRLARVVLAIGSFDGVHLGHQAVLRKVVEVARAQGATAAWITFDPHPRCVLDPANCPAQITTLEERVSLVRRLGLEHGIVLPFDRALAALSAEDFMAGLLRALDLRCLVAGHDFALGRGREGDVDWLCRHGSRHGYRVEVVPPLRIDGEEVHSSEVRRLLTLGEVEGANRLLGRDYGLAGLVEPGDRIGRTIGWPTVNLAVPPGKLVPARGIYAGWASTPFGERGAAISVGYRPQFARTDLRVEAYLLDFSGDLYRERIELRFVARLRDEARFPSVEAMGAQIARDVEATRRILGLVPPSP
ncbi:MAG TPA: bifunctional riboflavin kinase/FAD synthetase [Candidatus Dormibacteraeota bacterium]|jgi:riboflavin kinase/FMN adenylyltransferase|nr:bifunctional riboflavin kinase/FAD synthetase [Candidatus Dormibacteraeota bacterium]